MSNKTQQPSAEKDAPGPDYCPTCGARDSSDECATSTGRDHPARRQWSRAWRAGYAAGTRDIPPATTEADR